MKSTIINPGINLCSDIAFKMFLTKNEPENRYCLKRLLSAITGKTVTEVKICETEKLPEHLEGRNVYLDVNVIFDDGQKANLEMQVEKNGIDHEKRTVFYASKLYSTSASRGEKFSDFPNVYQVYFADFKQYDDDQIVHQFFMYDKKSNTQLTDSFTVIFIELPKLKKLFKKDAEGKLELSKNLNDLEFWSIILKYSDDERILLLKDFPKHKEDLHMTKQAFDKMADEWLAVAAQISIEKAQWDKELRLKYAEEQGFKKGKEQTANIMLKDNVPIESISKYTGLSIDKIKELQNNFR